MTGYLSQLTPGTTYHYRLVAHNSLGTTYGYDYAFTTSPTTPPPPPASVATTRRPPDLAIKLTGPFRQRLARPLGHGLRFGLTVNEPAGPRFQITIRPAQTKRALVLLHSARRLGTGAHTVTLKLSRAARAPPVGHRINGPDRPSHADRRRRCDAHAHGQDQADPLRAT